MDPSPPPIRIAILVKGQEFLCREMLLPFSLEGYPPVDLVLYGTGTDIPADGQVHLLANLQRTSSTHSRRPVPGGRSCPIWPRTG